MKKYLLLITMMSLFSSCWEDLSPYDSQLLWYLENHSDATVDYKSYLNKERVGVKDSYGLGNIQWGELASYGTRDDEPPVISFDDLQHFIDSFCVHVNNRTVVWTKDNSEIFGLDFYDESFWEVDTETSTSGGREYYNRSWTFVIDQAFVDSVMKYVEPWDIYPDIFVEP